LCVLNQLHHCLGQGGGVYLHSLTASSSTSSTNGHLGKRISGFISLLRQARDHSHGGIMLIERSAQLAPCLCQVLLQGVCFQSKRIPFLLEYTEQRRDGSEGGRSGSNNALRLDIDQIVGGEFFAIHRVLAILGNVGLNEALLENTAC
jgi:hypothetical protein